MTRFITGLGIAVTLGLCLTRIGYSPAMPQYVADKRTADPWSGIAEHRSTGIEIRLRNQTSEKNESSAAMTGLLRDLAASRSKAASLGSYTAVLEMQEERNGRLTDPKIIDIKFRPNPFSVYMYWRSNSQEALFVGGQNDAKVLVRPPGGLAAFRRPWRLDPDSRLAKQSGRYPVTEVGLLKLTERVQSFYQNRMHRGQSVECSTSLTSVPENEYREYAVRFPNQTVCEEYSAAHYRFETKSGLLLLVENFSWGEDGDRPLVEKYGYDSIDTSTSLNEADFDHRNPEYDFVARTD